MGLSKPGRDCTVAEFLAYYKERERAYIQEATFPFRWECAWAVVGEAVIVDSKMLKVSELFNANEAKLETAVHNEKVTEEALAKLADTYQELGREFTEAVRLLGLQAGAMCAREDVIAFLNEHHPDGKKAKGG